jgi:hypothetical protein
MAGGAGGRIPANSGGGIGQARTGNGLQVPRARFPGSEGSGAQPAGPLGGSAIGRPLEHALRRMGSAAWSTCGPGVLSMCQGGCQFACTAPAASGTGVSAAASNSDQRRSKVRWRGAHTRGDERARFLWAVGRSCVTSQRVRRCLGGWARAGTHGRLAGNSQCGRRRMHGTGRGDF